MKKREKRGSICNDIIKYYSIVSCLLWKIYYNIGMDSFNEENGVTRRYEWMRNEGFDALLDDALYFEEKGEKEKAEAIYAHLLSVMPEEEDVLHEAAHFYFVQGDTERALALFRRLLLQEEAADTHMMIAVCQLKLYEKDESLSRTKEAIRHFERGLALDENAADAAIYYDIGYACFLNGYDEKAKHYLEESLIRDGLYANSYFYLALLYLQEEAFETAERLLLQAIGLDSAQGFYFAALGDLYMRLTQYKKAIEAYEKAIALDAEDTESKKGLLEAYMRTGAYAKALKTIGK